MNAAAGGNAPTPVVLIVEDNAAYLLQLQKIFRMQGMLVLQAPDGVAGLQSAFEHLPDLVLADLTMPILGGLALCTFLKGVAATAEIPVILLHEGGEQEPPPWHAYAHADGVLDKFGDPEVLVQAAWSIFQHRGFPGARARAAHGAGAAGSGFGHDLVDTLVAQEMIRGDVSSLAPLTRSGNRHQLARAAFDVLGRVARYRAAGVFFLQPTYSTFFMHTLDTLPSEQLNGLLASAVLPLRGLLRSPIRLELFAGDDHTPRNLGRWTPQTGPLQHHLPVLQQQLRLGDQALGSIALIPAQAARPEDTAIIASFAEQFSLILATLFQFEESALLKRDLELARAATAAPEPEPGHGADVRSIVERVLRGDFGQPNAAQQRVLEAVLAIGEHTHAPTPDAEQETARAAYVAGREPTDLLRLIRDVCTSVQPSMQQARLRFEARIPSSAPAVRLDRAGIGGALATLLQNAIAHTPPGGKVTLWVIVEPDQIRIAVQDTGSGFDPAHEQHVFQENRPGESRVAGLSASRAIIEAHGGTIIADSKPGKGSLFVLTIPLGSAGLAGQRATASGVA